MGKHTKLEPPKVSKPKAARKTRGKAKSVDSPEGPTAAVRDQAAALLQRTIAHLEKLLSAVEETLDAGDANPALARESANVARAMTGISAELRQREKHERDSVGAMTEDERDRLVVEYLRELPYERRGQIRAFLDEIDEESGVL